ncbi:unnamed protein product [Rhizophagus irregularis]|nr:unnamed protein product [Rhizophagus irregularis]
MLCIISVVDNNYKSRIVASAIIDDDLLDTYYRWLFDTVLIKMGISSKVIFTDSDPSMIRAIKEIYPNTYHMLLSAKYLSDILYVNKKSWAIPWIYKRFTTGAQSTQRIESINKHIHDKVDQATSLCDLLHNIKDHVKNEEYLENFELE